MGSISGNAASLCLRRWRETMQATVNLSWSSAGTDSPNKGTWAICKGSRSSVQQESMGFGEDDAPLGQESVQACFGVSPALQRTSTACTRGFPSSLNGECAQGIIRHVYHRFFHTWGLYRLYSAAGHRIEQAAQGPHQSSSGSQLGRARSRVGCW